MSESHPLDQLEAGALQDTALLPKFSEVAILPHPSGRNRWYNDAANKARAQEFMRALAADAQESA